MEIQMEIFYNTCNLEGTELKERKIKAGSQNDRILGYFRSHPYQNFTPFEVQEALGMACINSVRRAITTLTLRHGLLVMNEERRNGRFGMTNNTWKLR